MEQNEYSLLDLNREEQGRTYSAALAPFVVEFTLALLLGLQGKTFVRPTKQAIHSDIVPKVSQHVMEAQMNERLVKKEVPKPSFTGKRIKPLLPTTPTRTHEIKQMRPSIMQKPTQISTDNPQNAWNKISPLLNDETVTHIECNGANKPLSINRHGRKQQTRILLSEAEIKNVLEHIAKLAHVPLLEGVFRAAVDTYNVNAIISDMIGSKFIIKKQTPYSMIG